MEGLFFFVFCARYSVPRRGATFGWLPFCVGCCRGANEFPAPAAVGSVATQPGTDGTLAPADKTSLAPPARAPSPTASYYTANTSRCARTESQPLTSSIKTASQSRHYSIFSLFLQPVRRVIHLPEFSLDSDSESEDSEDSEVFSGRFGS